MASWRRDPTPRADTWVAFRQVARHFPPLWHPGSRRKPTDQPSGRWHRSGEDYAQYFALDTDGAWSELVRYEAIRTESQRLAADLRVRLWRCWITETDIADLGTFDEIEAVGLDPALIIDDRHEGCQDLADELRAAGYRGLLSPSAALPYGQNLTLFGPRREIRSHLLRGPVRNPEFFIRVSLASDEAAPPPHILDLVRYWGDPHLEHLEWDASRTP